MAKLLSVDEAQKRILSFFQPLGAEEVPLTEAHGRTLAEDICAAGDLPPFDNSSMDGFAVRAADVQSATPDRAVALKVIGDVPAGTPFDQTVQPGQAVRIMTGAPFPAGADAVVPVEDTNFSPDHTAGQPPGAEPGTVLIYAGVQPGGYVRRRGSDVKEGQQVLRSGRVLQPQDIGLLSSIGKASVTVTRRPRVAVFSTGDELAQPGQPLRPGQIYDSNQYVLAALLEREGAHVIRLGSAPDDPRQVEALLQEAVRQQVDLIVTSAGVSVGAFDYVRQVIETSGSLDFWRVNMRPGKPLAFGTYSGIPLVGLPGNPVSAYIGCLVFVLPAVYRLLGREQPFRKRHWAVLVEPVESDGRESYLRAVVRDENGRLVARLTGHQGSSNVYSLVQANALLIVPSGVKSLPSDSEVEIWFFE